MAEPAPEASRRAGEAHTGSSAEGALRPLSATRRVVARRMAESSRTIPAVTLHRTALLATLLERRRQMAAEARSTPSIDAMLARAVAVALADFELLNGTFDENAMAVRVWPERHVAVAVDTERGLTPVVLRRADRRDELELSTELADLVNRARGGRLTPEDLAGATFTLTNLGSLGIDAFTPIILPPQAAILGVGRFRVDERDVPTTLSLTFDHRIVDGAYAARFLGRVAESLSEPPGSR